MQLLLWESYCREYNLLISLGFIMLVRLYNFAACKTVTYSFPVVAAEIRWRFTLLLVLDIGGLECWETRESFFS